MMNEFATIYQVQLFASRLYKVITLFSQFFRSGESKDIIGVFQFIFFPPSKNITL